MKEIFLRKRLFFISLLTVVLCSCSEDNEILSSLEKSSSNTEVSNNDNINEWEESYHPGPTTRGINKAYEFVPVGVKNLYTGMVLNGDDLNNGKMTPIICQLDPTSLVFTTPSYYITEMPITSFANYMRAFKSATQSEDFSGKQTEEFEYDLKQFSKYSELRLAFGANVNICSILKIEGSSSSTKITRKTGLFARICQKNFDAVIDYPEDGNIFKNNEDLSKYPSATYINSITYGRMAIISIESDSSYQSIKTAFKVALNAKKINGELSLDENTRKTLQTADVKIWIRGGKGEDVVKTIEGFDEFQNFIINGGTFTCEVPGLPIFCTVNRVDNNSAFETSFDIDN
jgi:thiol-activated cytolysin